MDQPPKLNDVSHRLRSSAREEQRLATRTKALVWGQVSGGRRNGYAFGRRVPIAPSMVDFPCSSARLVVEREGEPRETEERKIRDAKHDTWRIAQGFQILRFPNALVLDDLPVVMRAVEQAIDGRCRPSPASLREAPAPAEGGGPRTSDIQQVSP